MLPARKKMTISIKHHQLPEEGEVLAVADDTLIGETLEEGEMQLHVSKRFYHEETITEEELKEKLQESGNINLVGKKAFAVAREMGLVSEHGVRKIKGIPYTCIYKM
jgi:hypothetical protein